MRTSLLQRNIPILSPATETFLVDLLQKHKPMSCLEIGSAVGYSGNLIGATIKERGGKLITFEISQPAYKECLATLQKTKLADTVRPYPFNFSKIDHTKILPEKIDFAFVDGRKSEYDNYLHILQPYVHSKSVIVFDDIIKFHDRLGPLYTSLDQLQYQYEIIQLDPDDGIILARLQTT